MKRAFCIFFLLAIALLKTNGQEFGMGVLLDDELYKNSPKSPQLMRGDYERLPDSVSLKKYCPTAGYQGPYSTCAAWATAYGGRTILEALKYQWNKPLIDRNTFSPSFIYNQIRKSKGCTGGISLIDALDVLRDQGDIKLQDFAYDCEREVKEQDKLKAGEFKIIEYREILCRFTKNKSLLTRKSLSEYKPVVIAMDCPKSFQSSSEIWTPDSSDYKEWSRGHGMVVIGYNDNKYGGAFEILNSWGTNWGKEGFFWIRYSDFDYFVKFAFEIIDKSKDAPNSFDISGKLLFSNISKINIHPVYNGNYFFMKESWHSGDDFRLIITNEQPAYVYAIGSDLSNSTTRLFPYEDNVNAYLPYKKNNIVLPSEDYFYQLDNHTGTSYFCFLYSKKSLDINMIRKNIEAAKGSLWQRINEVLGEDLVINKEFNIDETGQISFNSKSNGKSVLPILVEIKHENKIRSASSK